MNTKALKYFIKSKSLKFAMNLNDKRHRATYFFWKKIKVHYRTCSSDMVLIYEILLKSKFKREYYFPEKINPKVIFDIGANIGITSIYLAKTYPEATIYSFEPLKDNFDILSRNASQFENIKVYNLGLGKKNGSFKIYMSDDKNNYGGVSFYSEVEGNSGQYCEECEVKNVNDLLKSMILPPLTL